MVSNIMSLLITSIPVNFLRIFFLNLVFRYKISYNSNVGLFNILLFNELKMDKSTIGSFNYFHASEAIFDCARVGNLCKFKLLDILEMRAKSWIKNKNSFIGSLDPNIKNKICKFTIGKNSLVTYEHYFDISKVVDIGDNVVFGGQGSQVWTHGYDHNRNLIAKDISIGNNIYVGSRSLFLPGANICDNVTIGAGTTVSKEISESGLYVSSALLLKKKYK